MRRALTRRPSGVATSLHDSRTEAASSGGAKPPVPAWGGLQHRLLFERNPQPMMVYERATDRILAVSDAAIAVYGYSREEFIGLPLVELIAEPDRAEFVSFQARAQAIEMPGLVLDSRRRHQRKDGTIIDVIVSADDLEVEGRGCRMLICEDVTAREDAHTQLAAAREQLRVSDERYRRLFEQNPQAMVAYDRATLEIVAVSNATVADYGYSREELEAMTILDLVLPEDVEVLKSYLGKRSGGSTPQMAGTPAGYPSRRQRKDGSIIDIEVTSENIELDGRDCRLALYTDVTERNRTMAELEDAREQLRASEERYRQHVRAEPAADGHLRPQHARDPRRQRRDGRQVRLHARGAPLDDHPRPPAPRRTSSSWPTIWRPIPTDRGRSWRGQPEGYPGQHRLKDGTMIDVEVTSDNLDLNGRDCRIAHFDDVTARNKAATRSRSRATRRSRPRT